MTTEMDQQKPGQDQGTFAASKSAGRDPSTTPVLTPDQIERIRVFAEPLMAAAGDVLYHPNAESPSVFIVESGLIRIFYVGERESREIIRFGPGQFSGEMFVIAGRRTISRCEVGEPSSLLVLSQANLRSLMAKDSELNDIFINAFLARRRLLTDTGLGNVMLLGSRESARTLQLREFLIRDGHPFLYVDLEDDGARSLLGRFGVSAEDIPVVVCNGDQVLRSPSPRELGEALGFNDSINKTKVWDLVVVGAGPGGLAAAVYGASEGLDVLVIDKGAPGGQAASSSKIENYLGFPTGLSGQELASRAIAQAEKFGASIMVARDVQRIQCDQKPYRICLDDGQEVTTRAIVFATGAQYNRPSALNSEAFTGRGVYYSATFMEVQACHGEEVIVIGGGNSAGQAAVFLSQHTQRVHLLVRSEGLCRSMSRYLLERIDKNPNISIQFCTELTLLEGDEHLERVEWRNKVSGKLTSAPIRHVFVMAGASPKTDWLSECLSLDRSGFIVTGHDLEALIAPSPWPLSRQPHLLETSCPSVFAVGDARSGSVKRVASAVGEGAIVVSFVHQVLAEV